MTTIINNNKDRIADTLEKGYGEPISVKQVSSFFNKQKKPNLDTKAKENINKSYIVITSDGRELYKTLLELMLDEKYFIEAEKLLKQGAVLPDPVKPIKDFETFTENDYLKHLADCGHDLFIAFHQMNDPDEQKLLLSVIRENYANSLETSLSLKDWISSHLDNEHQISLKR